MHLLYRYLLNNVVCNTKEAIRSVSDRFKSDERNTPLFHSNINLSCLLFLLNVSVFIPLFNPFINVFVPFDRHAYKNALTV